MDRSLYETIGVSPDATRAEIKKAGKKRRAETHPDAGGSVDEFTEISRALTVLLDPAARGRYDRYGTIQPKGPIEDDRAALAIVTGHMNAIVNEFVSNGFKPEQDPRRLDLVRLITDKIDGEIAMGSSAISVGRRHVAFLRDFFPRLKMKRKKKGDDQDLLRATIERQIEAAEEQVASISDSIRIHRLARDFITNYDFRKEEPPAFFSAGGFFQGGFQ